MTHFEIRQWLRFALIVSVASAMALATACGGGDGGGGGGITPPPAATPVNVVLRIASAPTEAQVAFVRVVGTGMSNIQFVGAKASRVSTAGDTASAVIFGSLSGMQIGTMRLADRTRRPLVVALEVAGGKSTGYRNLSARDVSIEIVEQP